MDHLTELFWRTLVEDELKHIIGLKILPMLMKKLISLGASSPEDLHLIEIH